MKGKKSPELTDEQKKFIDDNHHEYGYKTLARMLDACKSRVRAYCVQHGYKCNNDGRFRKGNVPFNKGKKWDEFMSKEGQENSRRTSFKKGNIPHNQKPMYSERVDSREGHAPFVLIKVHEGRKTPSGTQNYVTKARWVWEHHNGPIPKNHKIIHIDNNSYNNEIDNLMCVTNGAELLINRQKLMTDDVETNKIAIEVAMLQNKANEMINKRRKKRGQNNEKQD